MSKNVVTGDEGDSRAMDYRRLDEIIDRLLALDDCEAYYMKHDARYERAVYLAPRIEPVLAAGFAVSPRVLDIGCGRGRTLLDHAHLFRYGAGLDESAAHMIVPAIRDRDARGITNVEFFIGKAGQLLFDDGAFDMVFSERGPMGHNDVTLKEAMRVLRSGGLIFVETGGAFATLGVEKERFERHGVEVQTLACRTETFVFPDYYELFKYQLAGWGWRREDFAGPDRRERVDRAVQTSTGADGVIVSTRRTVWIAGSKGLTPILRRDE